MNNDSMRHRTKISLSLFFVILAIVFGNIAFAQFISSGEVSSTAVDSSTAVAPPIDTSVSGTGMDSVGTLYDTGGLNIDAAYSATATVQAIDASFGANTVESTSVKSATDTSNQTTARVSPGSLLLPKITGIEPVFTEPVSGDVVVVISTENVEAVNLHVLRDSAGIPLYLGRAESNVDHSRWKYAIRTKSLPNGRYSLTVAGKGIDGSVVRRSVLIGIYNPPNPTVAPEQKASLLQETQKIAPSIQAVNEETQVKEVKVKQDIISAVDQYAQTLQKNSVLEHTIDQQAAKNALQQEKQGLTEMVRKESQAINESVRLNDRTRLEAAKERILRNIDLSLERIRATNDASTTDPRLVKRLGEVRRATRERIENLEMVIREKEKKISERVGSDASKDFDQDGIPDYDEVNIYNTDPTSPDSDNDGYTDGAEILGGFDPLSQTVESSLVYEDPKENGAIRRDMFAVKDVAIKRLAAPEGGAEGSASNLVFSGNGLPNSFITLYIYSTPVIVVVKTDSDGNWSYILDRELSDGSHEVYAAITDNTGSILAKSDALPFVKQVEAVTLGSETIPVSGEGEEGFFNQGRLYIMAFVGAFVLGIALIGIGIIMGRQKPRVS